MKRGFTTVELLIAISILSLVMLSAMELITSKFMMNEESVRRYKAVNYLKSLQTEISVRNFDENTNAPWSAVLGRDGESTDRKEWNDIDDYNSYDESSSKIVNLKNEELSDEFYRTVSVTYVDNDSLELSGTETDTKRVFLEIFYKDGRGYGELEWYMRGN